MTHSPLISACAALALAGLLSGCAGAVIGAGATAGVAAAEERGLDGAVEDTRIRTEINDLWFRHDVEMYRKVTLAISEGRILLTGLVPTDQAQADAVRLAWQAAGVREVYNEIQVRPAGSGLIDDSRDVWIQQELKARLLFDKEVRNINYTVDVTDGVVYLLGIAQSEAELQRVIAHARELSHVKGVISHVRLKTDPRRNG
ncbi:BON domain-containing protein [Magnetospirillum sp. UT-4]|uniref:BON domain-containing protein n=1 Tax=Magnetospirillum sp. UT-4 TaxID=2681467 RepID=UPI00138579B8|nr:BON domain-containing protein [Magnetospirillum sp. UT-4]CAA7616298.1 Predicted periplasmic or secreted lipoprotein [Magnetospirillum sp. UT-4]